MLEYFPATELCHARDGQAISIPVPASIPVYRNVDGRGLAHDERDVGRAVVRPGDEILGFTAALLYAGAENVVSSVAQVSHPAAVAVMTRYHHEIAAGVAPARALAAASGADPLAPFVCFGAG